MNNWYETRNMTNWYETLKENMKKAIESNSQLRALNAANSAWDCYRLRRMTYNQSAEIQSMYDAWEKTWAE